MPTPTKRFAKILVGVDLAEEHRYVCKELSASTEQVVRRALWLAKASSAQLCFFYVLPPSAAQLSYDTQILLAKGEEYKTVFDHANEVLAAVAKSRSQHGVETSSKVVTGTCWIEIIREVLRGHYDLAVVGTRRKGAFKSMLFGHTGIKLLRKCPCPVWAMKPQSAGQIPSILVAHDLTVVGEAAMELGCWLAREQGATLHVLHAIGRNGPTGSDRGPTLEAKEQRIQDQLACIDLDDTAAHVHVATEPAEHAILCYIEEHNIQLVVMGTIARTGIAGLIVGNTAEKLLPFLPCSVLAVKPAGFKSPVMLDYGEYEDEFV